VPRLQIMEDELVKDAHGYDTFTDAALDKVVGRRRSEPCSGARSTAPDARQEHRRSGEGFRLYFVSSVAPVAALGRACRWSHACRHHTSPSHRH